MTDYAIVSFGAVKLRERYRVTLADKLAHHLPPKGKGGIGIMDLDRFTRALRLRWLWFKLKQKERAWTNLEVPCDKTDHELFNASTRVNIGDGKIVCSGLPHGLTALWQKQSLLACFGRGAGRRFQCKRL